MIFYDNDFDDYGAYQYGESFIIPSTRSAARAAAASAASPYSGMSQDPMAIFDDETLSMKTYLKTDRGYEWISTSFANAESKQDQARLIQDGYKTSGLR